MINQLNKIIIGITLLISTSVISFAQNSGNKLLFNQDWKFHKGDVSEGEGVQLNDASWRKLDLPHDWSIEAPFSQQWASATAYLPGGIGWYRKSFKIPSAFQNKKVFIYFDGVYKNSKVWINGHLLGNRPNGFIPFEYELTNYLNKKGDNLIAVEVDHTQFADSRWYTGSGINRNVFLIGMDPIHISQWGVAFQTSLVSNKSATARVDISINNQTFSSQKAIVRTELTDSLGKTVAKTEHQVSLKESAITQTSETLQILKPALWSVENPCLYRLKVTVLVDKKVTDVWMDKVGIRSFNFDPNKGFTLNGTNMKLKGICLHDDAGTFGTAVPEEVWERRLITLKAAGCNAIRMSHNPHDEAIYQLCDRLGFLVMDEAFDEWEVGKNKWIKGWNVGVPGNDGYHEYFKKWVDVDLKDMILRNRNRPSIIMWSIGNEIDYPNDPYTSPVLDSGKNPQIYGKGYLRDHPLAEKLGELSAHLVQVAKTYDQSRPITSALAGVVMSNTTTYPGNLDIVGYNYQEYRYEEDHKKYPNRVIYGSENGMSLDAWDAVNSNDFIAGQFLWTGIDYMGEAGRWPDRSSNSGLLDLAGFPKPLYYFRKSLWTTAPMIFLGAMPLVNEEEKSGGFGKLIPDWNWGKEEKVRIGCFSNCQFAELFLNGKSLGKKEVVHHIAYWDTNYQAGRLEVKGYSDKKLSVSDELKTAGEVSSLRVESYSTSGKPNHSFKQIAIQLIDKNGNPIYKEDIELNVKVEGPAILLGLESGSSSIHEDYKSHTRKTFHGKLMVYIKKSELDKKVKVIFQSPGLKTQVIIL